MEDSPAVSISCHANATGTTPSPATGTGEDMKGNRRKMRTFYIKKPVETKKGMKCNSKVWERKRRGEERKLTKP